ncbi:MAG: Gfo/Idh/MocA family oxidoreductase [Anaerolineales bacterium]|nr:MAG: Gfo/Idh/MocA family oxidoreductase [Anaerolineales bacterium]
MLSSNPGWNMKFLIVGYGSIGRRHFQNLNRLGEQDLLFLRTGQSTLDDQELGSIPVEHDLLAAIQRRPDAAIIATPTAKHLEVAIPLAEEGISLMIEKPISHEMEGVEALMGAANSSQAKILIGYQFRFHPSLIFIKKALEQGLIGEPLSVRSHWGEYLPGWHPWEDFRNAYSARRDLGGGVILTLSHPIDYLHWMFGAADSVTAEVAPASYLALDVEDHAEIIIQFSSGVLASVHLNYFQKRPEHSLVVLGTEGSLHWDCSDGVVYHSSSKNLSRDQVFTLDQFERNDMFLAEMEHFIQLVRGNAPSICDLEDGIATLKLCLGALRSSALGQRVLLAEATDQ